MKREYRARFILIGRANTGKTLFILNFSEYMGYKNLAIKFKSSVDEIIKNDTIYNFKNKIVASTPNTTRCLQIASIEIPVLKGKRTVEFTDTTGLSSSIHFDQSVRDGMVQTLSLLKEDGYLLHMLDAPAVSIENSIDNIDIEIYRYGKRRGNYLVMANKMDLPSFSDGYKIICEEFTDVKIFKISALQKMGFDEVKKHVSRLI